MLERTLKMTAQTTTPLERDTRCLDTWLRKMTVSMTMLTVRWSPKMLRTWQITRTSK